MPLQVFVRDVNYLHKKTYGKVLGLDTWGVPCSGSGITAIIGNKGNKSDSLD
jgi:hypothetical protein